MNSIRNHEIALTSNAATDGIKTRLRRGLAFIAIAVAVLAGASEAALAQAETLVGSWSGTGYVSFAGGNRERARCRVRYTAESATVLRANGTCVSESGTVSQTATLKKVGSNTYSGTFYNSEYDIRGSVEIVVRGNSHTLRLNADAGSAEITLSR